MNSTTKIIVRNGMVQYPTKEQRALSIEEADSSALGGHIGVTKTYNRIRQKFFWQISEKNLFAYLDRRKEYLLTKAEIFKSNSFKILAKRFRIKHFRTTAF